MYAIEFEADVQNGFIKIPSQYKELESKHLRIIALLDNSEMIKPMQENKQFTDEYINDHWRELIITASTDPLQNDDKIWLLVPTLQRSSLYTSACRSLEACATRGGQALPDCQAKPDLPRGTSGRNAPALRDAERHHRHSHAGAWER